MAEESSHSDRRPSLGLLSALQSLCAAALDGAQVRLALLSAEMEQERRHLLRSLVWAAVAVMLGTLACLFAAGGVVLLCWDTPYRWWAFGGVTAALSVATLGAAHRARHPRRAGGADVPLALTLAQLKSDSEALRRAAQDGREGWRWARRAWALWRAWRSEP